MKTLLAAAVLTLAATGCIVVPARGRVVREASTAPAKKCPPGHVWSDGSCRDRGHGNDKDKKR